MRARTAALVVLSAVFYLIHATSLAAQIIQGTLIELTTDRPIPDATIALVASPTGQAAQGTQSGRDGSFVVTAPAPGIYRLRVERPGYRPAVTPALGLEAGDRVSLNLRMLPDTQMLRPVTVTATNRRPPGRLGGFYERAQRRTFGRFITRDEIEKRHPLLVSDLLRTMPGIEVIPTLRGNAVRTVEGCVPNVFLDGMYFPLIGESIDDIIIPTALEGIEVYAHPTEVPVEFQRPGNNCGAIVLWTHY
jgi:carboxypeptidase family protein